MRTFFLSVGAALLFGMFSPAPASAQTDPCTFQVNMNSAACIAHGRDARSPVPYQDRLLCTLIHLKVGTTRKVTFVVKDSSGVVLNPDNLQHTSDKVDGDYMCVGWHWWQKAIDTGGSVEFCIDFETGYTNRYVYRFNWGKVSERVAFNTQYAPEGRFIAGLRVN